MNFKTFTGTALSLTLGTLSGYAILAGGYANAETNTQIRISQQQPTQPDIDTQQPFQPGVQTQPDIDTQQPFQPGVQTQPGFEDDFEFQQQPGSPQQQVAPQQQPIRGMW